MKPATLFTSAVAILALLLASGCQKGKRVCVYNRTGADITVVMAWGPSETQKKVIANGAKATFPWPNSVEVIGIGKRWTYPPFPSIPTSLLEEGRADFYLNLEVRPNGSCYAVFGKPPVVGNQPPGFPLLPLGSGAS